MGVDPAAPRGKRRMRKRWLIAYPVRPRTARAFEWLQAAENGAFRESRLWERKLIEYRDGIRSVSALIVSGARLAATGERRPFTYGFFAAMHASRAR
jgi:hypothetical protein